MTNWGFRLEGDLVANIDGLDTKIQRGMIAAANYVAPRAESWMKANASWTDRTGAARNGLRARVMTNGNKVAVVLYHSVPYGVFLEVRWSGKYAILEPALAQFGPEFAQVIKRLVFD